MRRLQLIRDKGFEHEAAVLARLEKLHGPAERIPAGGSLTERVRAHTGGDRTRRDADLSGCADQGGMARLSRLPCANRLCAGAGLCPEDAKLSRKAKGEYLLQLGIYAELLETLFGIPVQSGTIHVAVGDPESFDLRRTRYILKRLMRSFERFVADETRVTKPLPCAACAQCDYKPRCEDEWRKADSPFFVAGVSGAQVVKLAAAGVHTLSQLAALSPATKIDGMGADTVAKLSAQARLQLAARKTGKHGFELLPRVAGPRLCNAPRARRRRPLLRHGGRPARSAEGLEYLFGIYGRLNGATDRISAPSGRTVRSRRKPRSRARCASLSIKSGGIRTLTFITMPPTSPRR